MTQKILHEFNQLVESFKGMNYTTECSTLLSLSLPYFWKQLLDHPLNHLLNISGLKKKEDFKTPDASLCALFE